MNGATCVDLVAGLSCVCAPGWTGYFCENGIRYFVCCVQNTKCSLAEFQTLTFLNLVCWDGRGKGYVDLSL